jgi:ferritin-like metal-binding protein YciE
MELSSIQDLMVMTLKDLHSAEMQWLNAAPEIMKAATSPDLVDAMMKHVEISGGQVKRLEQALKSYGEQPDGKPSKAMQGLVAEARELVQMRGEPDVIDAAIICAQQKIEHNEIAGYGTAVTFAKLLGDEQAARLLAQTLDEEEKTDRALSALAKSKINSDAQAAAPSA